MIDAIGAATSGMLGAQKRAAKLATEIVDTASKQASLNDLKSLKSEPQKPSKTLNEPVAAPSDPTDVPRPLVQQIVDLQSTERQFQASAVTFAKVVEMQDQLTGALFDDES